MIKTFIIDLPVLMLFGLVFSKLSRPGDLDKPLHRNVAFAQGLRFTSVFILSVMVCYMLRPDWMWMYFPDSTRVGFLGLIYLLFFLYYVPYTFGFMVGIELQRHYQYFWGWVCIAGCTVVEVIIVRLMWDRYFHVGTREAFLQFLDGKQEAVQTLADFHALSAVMNISGVILVVYFIYLWRNLPREG